MPKPKTFISHTYLRAQWMLRNSHEVSCWHQLGWNPRVIAECLSAFHSVNICLSKKQMVPEKQGESDLLSWSVPGTIMDVLEEPVFNRSWALLWEKWTQHPHYKAGLCILSTGGFLEPDSRRHQEPTVLTQESANGARKWQKSSDRAAAPGRLQRTRTEALWGLALTGLSTAPDCMKFDGIQTKSKKACYSFNIITPT
jgi:hypothetical protein